MKTPIEPKALQQFKEREYEVISAFFNSDAFDFLYAMFEEEMRKADQVCIDTDPVTDATKIARAQGALDVLQRIPAEIKKTASGQYRISDDEVKEKERLLKLETARFIEGGSE